MGNSIIKENVSAVNVKEVNTVNPDKPKCKACCACPETKKARDQCVLENGEENCSPFIEAHKKCMRDLGFNI